MATPIQGRRILAGLLIYATLVFICSTYLLIEDELSIGRHPVQNILKTAKEMGRPSFLDLWFGDEAFHYISEDGTVLRTENRQELEKDFIKSIGRALWITFVISTLGTALGSLFSLPFALGVAANISKPRALAWFSKIVLDSTRSIHTLVFGLIFVGIIGLGPTAGILAIAAHSMGTFGKLYAESIETIDMGPINAIRGVGANSAQVFSFGFLPAMLPQFLSVYLYLWEFNTRDSTVLGLIGAGGLGLLISESISLFQWGRLSTLLLTVVVFVMLFDWVSRHIRQELV